MTQNFGSKQYGYLYILQNIVYRKMLDIFVKVFS